MTEYTGQFACAACGRKFRWRAEMAGRAGKCPCGEALVCPPTDPSDDPYELANEQTNLEIASVKNAAASPAGAASSIAPLASPTQAEASPRTVATAAAPPTLAYARKTPATPDTAAQVHLMAPIWIVAGGLCIETAAAFFQRGLSPGFAPTLDRLGASMLLSTALMLVAVLIAVKFRGITLGPFWPAVLKLAAISIGPRSLIDLMTPILMLIPFAGLLAALVEFAAFFALLGFFFNLDESDTWYCVSVMFIINVAFAIALPLF